MITVPLWIIFALPIVLGVLIAFCAYLVLNRQNYYASVLLKNSIEVAEERKAFAALTAQGLGKKIEESAGATIGALQDDLKGVHRRLHALEGSVAHKEGEISQMLDAYEERQAARTAVLGAGPKKKDT